MHSLSYKLHHTTTQPVNEAVLFHYVTAISLPVDCQPHRGLLLHLNHQTHAITPHTYDHHTEHFTIHLHWNSNIPYVIYTSASPDKDPTTTLLHLAPTPRLATKRKKRPRATNILPNATQIIAPPPPDSALHMQTSLLTAAHLVLTATQFWIIPWNILRHTNITAHTLHRVISVLCLHTSYPLWTSTIGTTPQLPSHPILAQHTVHNQVHPSIDTHLTHPSLPPPPPLFQNGRKVRVGER